MNTNVNLRGGQVEQHNVDRSMLSAVGNKEC